MHVSSGDGYLQGTVGRVAPHIDFEFSPLLNPNPVSPLWTVGDISFTLTRARVVLQNRTFLLLRGIGTLTGPGTGTPPQRWFLKAQQLGGTYTFASSTAARFPEPTSLGLLTVGLLSAAGLRRRLRR